MRASAGLPPPTTKRAGQGPPRPRLRALSPGPRFAKGEGEMSGCAPIPSRALRLLAGRTEQLDVKGGRGKFGNFGFPGL